MTGQVNEQVIEWLDMISYIVDILAIMNPSVAILSAVGS